MASYNGSHICSRIQVGWGVGHYVLMRGILPEVDVEAGEEVREAILHTMKDSDSSLREHKPADFEYIEASGKCMSVPAQLSGFEWTGRAVKQLSGTGAVYVWLWVERDLDEVEFSDDSSTSSSDAGEPDVKVIKVERPGECFSSGPRTL